MKGLSTDAIADRIEAEYTPYPLDADGVPCRLGDRVKSGKTCGDIKEMLLFERGGERQKTNPKFCPNCGAKVTGAKEVDDER